LSISGTASEWQFRGTNPLTLNSGISLTSGQAYVGMPLVLGASNTWNMAGANEQLEVSGGLSGSHSLSVNLSDPSDFLTLSGSSNEVGPVTLTTTSSSSANVQIPHDLNSNGQPVGLNHVGVSASGTMGAITTSNGATLTPQGQNGLASALSATSATFDPSSTISFVVSGTGTTPGTDNSELTSSGNVNLARAFLRMSVAGMTYGSCSSHPAVSRTARPWVICAATTTASTTTTPRIRSPRLLSKRTCGRVERGPETPNGPRGQIGVAGAPRFLRCRYWHFRLHP
jgi:hypothetical protein